MMFATKVGQFFKTTLESFWEDPIWTWKVPMGKKHLLSYNKTLAYCRMSQYFVAGLAFLLTVSFEYSRQLIVTTAIRDGVILFVMEGLTYWALAYFMGCKRIPANYIPLAIMKLFIVLEKSLKPQVHDFQLKSLQSSKFGGHWYQLSYEPSEPEAGSMISKVRSVSLTVFVFIAAWTITKLTTFDISSYEKTALSFTTAGTSSAAMLLVSTFAFQSFPEFKEVHKRFCEAWMIYAVIIFTFLMMFLFQRLQKSVHGSTKGFHNMRMQWECIIFAVALYIMISYVPVIHKGFSVKELLFNFPKLCETVVPTPVLNFGKICVNYVYEIGETITDMQAEMMTNED